MTVVWMMVVAVLSVSVTAVGANRAMFVFGDSLVDSGNNNYLATSARADRRPYGIDFPTHMATGRFSNGYNIIDLLSENLGTQQVLPYLHPAMHPAMHGKHLLAGANFASAGVGILNDTGFQFVNIIRMARQLELFKEYQSRVAAMIGWPETRKLVANGVVSITVGGNDYVNNYYLTPFSLRSRQFTITDFTRYIVSEYRKILVNMYDLGGRMIIITAIGPMGCAPASRATRTMDGSCDPALQRAALLFNDMLRPVVNELNAQYGSTVYIMANSFNMNMDLIDNPGRYGFDNSNTACCGQGRYNGIGLCTGLSSLCAERDKYLYWDNYHPSERACRIIAQRFMTGDAGDMHPLNLTTLLSVINH